MRGAIHAGLGLAIFGAAPAATAHEVACGPQSVIFERLQREFGERVVAAGTLGSGELTLLAVNERSGSFTILVVGPRGGACILLAGEEWGAAGRPPGLGL